MLQQNNKTPNNSKWDMTSNTSNDCDGCVASPTIQKPPIQI